jgi:hypothetical protein
MYLSHSLIGTDAPATFKGTWSKTNQGYEGTITFFNTTTAPATLLKGASCPPPVPVI